MGTSVIIMLLPKSEKLFSYQGRKDYKKGFLALSNTVVAPESDSSITTGLPTEFQIEIKSATREIIIFLCLNFRDNSRTVYHKYILKPLEAGYKNTLNYLL